MKLLPVPLLAFLLVAVAGCSPGNSDSTSDSVLKHITLMDDRVGANSASGSTAWIDSTGTLEIDGKEVVLNPEQQALALRYQADAHAIRDQGIEIGKSGAKIAGTAIKSVVEEMRSGSPEKIGSRVEAEAKVIEAQAHELCAKIGQLQASQDALVAEVPAFLPYATITDETAADCRVNRVAAD